MARVCAAFLLLAGIAAFAPANAAEFDLAPPTGGHQPIVLRGAIVTGDEARFETALAAASNPILVLASPGGLVFPALAIGRRVSVLGIATVVPNGADCASACSFIWLAGSTRFLSEHGRIGLHVMSLMEAGDRVETHAVDYQLRHYLTQLGYSLDTTATIVNTPAAMIRWMDVLELNAAGVATVSLR